MWVRNNEILRLTPRRNSRVNDYWMCDHGRLDTFKWVNASNRIKAPMIRKDGELMEVGWDEAIATAAMELKTYKKHEIAGIGSPFATNEDNYLFVKLMYFLGVNKFDFQQHSEGTDDTLLLRADKAPNSLGAKEVGILPVSASSDFNAIIRDINDGSIKALYVIDDNVTMDASMTRALSKIDFLVVHASTENELTKFADVVLSSSTYAEKNGTMTNFEGHVQRIRPAITTAEQDRALDGFAMSRLDKFGAQNDRWMNSARHDARPTWRILTGVANALGAKWKYNGADEVFAEIVATFEAFREMSYMRIGQQGMTLRRKPETVSTARS